MRNLIYYCFHKCFTTIIFSILASWKYDLYSFVNRSCAFYGHNEI